MKQFKPDNDPQLQTSEASVGQFVIIVDTEDFELTAGPGAGGESSAENFETAEKSVLGIEFRPQYQRTVNLTTSQQATLRNFYNGYSPYEASTLPGGIDYDFFKIFIALKAESDAAGVEFGIRFFYTYYEVYRAAIDQNGQEVAFGTAFPDGTYRNGDIPMVVHTHPSGRGPSPEDLQISKYGGGLTSKQIFAAIGNYIVFYGDQTINGLYKHTGYLYKANYVQEGEGQGKGETDKSDTIQIKLMDANQNFYNWEDVTLQTPDFNGDEGVMRIPKPYVMKANGEIIERGAKVMITFPFGRKKPIVTGALLELGTQRFHSPDLRVAKERLGEEKYVKEFKDGRFEYKIDAEGNVSYFLDNGAFRIVAGGDKAAIVFHSGETATIEGEMQMNVLGDIVEVGGNQNRLAQGETFLVNKASEVNVYSKKINLGHSQKRGKVLPVDPVSNASIDNPKFQNAVMGVTLEKLLDNFLQMFFDCKFIGNGVVTALSVPDKTAITNAIKNKLPKIKSEVVYLLKRADITE